MVIGRGANAVDVAVGLRDELFEDGVSRHALLGWIELVPEDVFVDEVERSL
jgi:hypothetical protein